MSQTAMLGLAAGGIWCALLLIAFHLNRIAQAIERVERRTRTEWPE